MTREAIKVFPSDGLRGEISVPGDKSISHRAVIMASIATGTSVISGFLEGEDNMRTVEAFRAMGVRMERPSPSELSIEGVGMHGLREPDDVLYAGNSGTTARLMAGLLAPQPFFSVITGDGSLRKRPMKRVVGPLSLMGASIAGRAGGEYLPIAINGNGLRGISYTTPVASAQLKSALLLAGLYAEGETVIEEPRRSRDHTERMLRLFGARLDSEGTRVTVRKTDELKARTLHIPGDISSAAFFIVGALVTPGSKLVIKGVGLNPTRCGIIDILRKMGAAIDVLNATDDWEPSGDIRVRSSELRGVEIDGAELLPAIDEFPVLCVAASFARGSTTIRGAGELRVKESDRIAVMSEVLGNTGVETEELEDGIVIRGAGSGGRIEGGSVSSHGDHRIAMAMAVAGLWSRNGVEIEDPGCVDVSFPGFFDSLDRVASR